MEKPAHLSQYRFICLVVSLGILSFRLAFPNSISNTSIQFEQLVIIFLFGTAFLISYVSSFVRIHADKFLYILAFICTGWLIRYTAFDHYQLPQLVMVIMLPLLFGLLIQTIPLLLSYLIFYLGIVGITIIFYPPTNFHPDVFLLITTGITIFFFFTIRSRIQLANALSESQQLWQTVFKESADSLIVLHEKSWKPILYNDQAIKLFPMITQETSSLTFLNQFSPRLEPTEQLDITKIIEKGKYWKQERIVVSPDNSPLWTEIIIKPIQLNEKKHLFLRIADINNQKQVEEAFQNKQKELEDMNKFMVGRELKMAELKKENEELKKTA